MVLYTYGMGLPAEIARRLQSTLNDTRGLVSAYVFGSMAEGRVHRDSDIDLGVLLDRRIYPSSAERFDVRVRLIPQLQASAGREVDLVILNDAPPHLARRIMSDGQRLIRLDPAADHAHLRLVLSRAADLEPFLRRARAVKLAAIRP
jgi:predicted nucleotidyltransferase